MKSTLSKWISVWKQRENFKFELAAAILIPIVVIALIVWVARSNEKRATCLRDITYTSDHRYMIDGSGSYYTASGNRWYFGTQEEAIEFCFRYRKYL